MDHVKVRACSGTAVAASRATDLRLGHEERDAQFTRNGLDIAHSSWLELWAGKAAKEKGWIVLEIRPYGLRRYLTFKGCPGPPGPWREMPHSVGFRRSTSGSFMSYNATMGSTLVARRAGM